MKLPKKIHFTCKNKNDIKNPVWNSCLSKFYKMYSDYEIIIHDNSDIYNIVEKHFPQYLEQIKKISVGAVLADIFRYLILYLEGGIYSDLDCEPIKHIDMLLDKDYQYFHGNEKKNNNFYIYKNNKIINNQWDFYHNICNNSEIINDKGDPIIAKCLGHKINIENISTILCYEFNEDFLYEQYKNKAITNIQVCQWFMISEPNQDIFLKMFIHCMENIDKLINIKNDKNYTHTILNTSGPIGFTKIVLNNLSNKIKILPSDFFCCGSYNNIVPFTDNSFIKHKFTGSWRV